MRVGLRAGAVVASTAGVAGVGAAVETDHWFIDQAMAQYETYRARQLAMSSERAELEHGEVHYCGTRDDQQHWAVVYVHPGGDAVKPLGVGEFKRAVKAVAGFGDGPPLWDRVRFPPPAVVFGGVRHFFRPALGSILLGVAQMGDAAVILSALGEQLAWIHVEGNTRRVIFVGPLDVVEVDAERMLRLTASPPTTNSASRKRAPRAETSATGGNDRPPAPPKVVRASAAIEAHHHRILDGALLDPAEEARVARVLRRGFAGILRRALVPATRPKGGKLLGKKTVKLVLWMICELAIGGRGDFVDTLGQIAALLRREFPQHPFKDYALRKALILIADTGTCILGRNGKTWAIKTRDLRNPTSARHRQFCEETGDGCPDDELMLDEMAETVSDAGPRPSGRAAGSAEPASTAKDEPAKQAHPADTEPADKSTPSEVSRPGDVEEQAGKVNSTSPGVAPATSTPLEDPPPAAAASTSSIPTPAPIASDFEAGFEAGFSLAIMLCLLALLGDGSTAEEKKGDVVDGGIETAPCHDDEALRIVDADERNVRLGDTDVGDEVPLAPTVEGEAASVVPSGTADEGGAVGDTDVAGDLQLEQAQVVGDAARPSGADHDGGDVSAPAPANPGDVPDEVNLAGPGDADVGDAVQLLMAPIEGDARSARSSGTADGGCQVSDIVSEAVVGPDAIELRNAAAGEGRDAGNAVSEAVAELDPTGSRDADVDDAVQRGREPLEEDNSGADDAAAAPAASGDAGSSGNVADHDGPRARAAPGAAPPQDLLSILGPRGPPHSES